MGETFTSLDSEAVLVPVTPVSRPRSERSSTAHVTAQVTVPGNAPSFVQEGFGWSVDFGSFIGPGAGWSLFGGSDAGDSSLIGRYGGFWPADRVQLPNHSTPGIFTEPQWRAGLMWSRWLDDYNPLAIGFRDHVVTFIGKMEVAWVRRGQQPGSPAAGEQQSDQLLRIVEEFWEQCCEEWDWGEGDNDREKESRHRLLRDGDLMHRLGCGKNSNDVPWIRFIEPEQVRSPTGVIPAGNWSEDVADWRWGVHCHPDDEETELAYWVCDPDSGGAEGEVVTADQVVRCKANVDRTIRRGKSDFFCVESHLQQIIGILGNMEKTSREQSRIAWIQKWANSTPDQLRALLQSPQETYGAESNYANTPTTGGTHPAGGRMGFPLRTHSGTDVLHVGPQTNFEPGPTSQGIPSYTQAVEATLKTVGFRWGVPDWFAGGSADSFAAVLATGSPFVRQTEDRQQKMAGMVKKIAKLAVILGERMGRLPPGTSKQVKPVVTASPVVMADEGKKATVTDMELRNKLISPQEAIRERNRDPKQVIAEIHAWEKEFPSAPPGGPPGPGGPGGGPPGGPGGPSPNEKPPAPPGSAGGDGSDKPPSLDDLISKESWAWTVNEAGELVREDRSHLRRKKITNSRGVETWVWYNPDKDKEGEGRQPGAPKPQGADYHPTLEAETAVAQAINDPSHVHPGKLEGLVDHLNTLQKQRLVEQLKQVKLKVSGRKGELVDRLMGYLQGHQPKVPQPGDLAELPTSHINVDPERFQFKQGVNKQGVTKELLGVKTFNPELAGIVSVWFDPELQKTFVINGHHRVELAERTGYPKIAVRYLEARDGREARAKGALINLAGGRGTALDAAKFMRDSGVTPEDLEKHGISLRGKLAADASILTKLNDRDFDRLARGQLDTDRALAVAKHVSDPDRQHRLFKLLEKKEEEGKDYSTRTVEEMARQMAAAPKATKTESTLWGTESTDEDTFVERAELAGYVRSELAKEEHDFAAVASERRAGRVAGAGNTLNVSENAKRAEAAEHAKNLYDLHLNLRGGIADALDAGSVQLKKAKTKKERERVRAETLTNVTNAIREKFASLDTGGKGGLDQVRSAGGGTQPGSHAGPQAQQSGGGGTQPAGLGNYMKSPGLSAEDAQLEQESQHYAAQNYDKIKDAYLKEMGTPDPAGGFSTIDINTDEVRHHLPGYKGTNAAAVHEASSSLAKKIYADALKSQRGKGNNKFMVLAGGGGSGKGTAIGDYFDKSKYPLVLDQVSGNLAKLEKALQDAKDNGYDPEYVFVDRPPEDAWGGVVGRAVNKHKKGELPRTVPVERALADNLDARKTALALLKKRPDIMPKIIDNRGGNYKRRLIEDRDEAIKYLEEQVAAHQTTHDAGLKDKLVGGVMHQVKMGLLPEHIAIGLVGKDVYNKHAGETRNPQEGRTA